MIRALRIFALAGLLAFGVFVAFEYAFAVEVFPPFDSLVPELLRQFFKTTGFALTFTSGVVAVVVCLQRRQFRWAAAFILLLILAAYGLYLAFLLLNVPARLRLGSPPLPALLLDPNVIQYIPAMLLALLVLIYSFLRSRASATAGAAAPAPGQNAGS